MRVEDEDMDIIINRVAIWSPKASDKLTTRRNPIGSAYRTKDSNIVQGAETPVYRFAKNYEVDGQKFCLFVRTLKNDAATIEKELDDAAQKFDKDYISKVKVLFSANPLHFEYTDYYILEDKE